MKFTATPVLWVKVWGTKPGANETVAKDLIKSLISADVNSGKTEYSEDDILVMFEYAYGRAGSKNAKSKARQTWTRYAQPSKEGWFAKVA